VPIWTFGDLLRKVRRHAGFDQREFAQKLQVPAGTLGNWENDTSRPRDVVAVARRVELLTGVPAAWLLGVDETSPRPGTPGGGSSVLPRLDSNQQPFGYQEAQVTDLAEYRREREQRTADTTEGDAA